MAEESALPPKKKKKQKQPNPLSCKKKKKKTNVTNSTNKSSLGSVKDKTIDKKKRKRIKIPEHVKAILKK